MALRLASFLEPFFELLSPKVMTWFSLTSVQR